MKKNDFDASLRVLVVTSEWPTDALPSSGIFVYNQVKQLQKNGIGVDVLNFRGSKSPREYFKVYLRLKRTVANGNYDLIHAHFGQAGFISILVGVLPVVVTFHGSDLFGLGERSIRARIQSLFLRTSSRISAMFADAVILASSRLVSQIRKRDCYIIPMGIDKNLFFPMAKEHARMVLGWPMNEKIVLFAANPANPIKRYELAEAAVEIVARSLPEVRLRICDGQPHEIVALYMNAANVLVVTSKHEAGPRVVREALACNLPVVSVDVGDVCQRIIGEQGCWLCEDESPDTIAKAIKRTISHEGYVYRASNSSDLDEEAVVQKLREVYSDVLSTSQLCASRV